MNGIKLIFASPISNYTPIMLNSESMFLDARLLTIFCVAAEELHFGKAAAALFMSQPALSQQIKRLEEQVGAQLFIRTTRTVRLTPAGSLMYRHAKQIGSETEYMLRRVRQASRGEAGSLSIGLTPTAACTPLADALHRYRCSHPEIELDLHEFNSIEMPGALRLRTIDVALMRPTAVDADIQTEQIYQEAMQVAVRRDHPLERFRSVTLEQITKYPMIGYRKDQSPYFRQLIHSLFLQARLTPKIVQESVVPTLLTLVEAGVGIAIVPCSLGRARDGALRFLPLSKRVACKASIIVAGLYDQPNPAVPDFVRVMHSYRLEGPGM